MMQALTIRQALFGNESLEAAECHNMLAKSYLKLIRSNCLSLRQNMFAPVLICANTVILAI